MSSDSSFSRDYGRFDDLAEEFAERYRRGERPGIQEYVDRLPEMAEEIREIFPALVEIERADGDVRVEAIRPAMPVASDLNQIGDYRILHEIGRGGMGVVYEAEQISLGRRVALKVLPGHALGDRKAQERFRREAKSAARLHHTNIVPVFEVGLDQDVSFYAMQLIQGQGLDQVVDELRRIREPGRKSGALTARSVASRPASQAVEDLPNGMRSQLTEVVESLLRNQRATEAVGSNSSGSPEQIATEPGASQPAPGQPRVSLDGDGSTPKSGGSAVMPCGKSVSDLDSSGRRHSYFRSVAQIGRQAAQGMAHAHTRGVIHRDIKPSNLMLDTEGVIWITDFGLAKSEEDGLTATGDILGTLRYMSPERFRGQGDARADIYALGMTLYEMLTLRPAFESANRLTLIEQVKNGEPPPPRSIDRQIPRDLETIILKAIEKEPERRYQTADTLAEDLRRFLADEPVSARPVGLLERIVRWARRRPTLAIAYVLALLALGLGSLGGFAAWQWLKAERLNVQTERSRQEAIDGQGRAQTAEAAAVLAETKEREARRDAERQRETIARIEYGRTMELAHQEWRENHVGVALALLEGADPRFRGWEWNYLNRISHSALKTLRDDPRGISSVSFSPDGRRILTASGKKAKVWDATIGVEILTLIGHKEGISSASFSPDGSRILTVSGGDKTARVWDARTGIEICSVPAHRSHAYEHVFASFNHDGSRFVTAIHDDLTDDYEAKIWDAWTGAEIFSCKGQKGKIYSASFSPDGSRLATRLEARGLTIWDAQTGTSIHSFLEYNATGGAESSSFSPDGSQLVSTYQHETSIRDVASGKERFRINVATKAPAFSPDGSRIIGLVDDFRDELSGGSVGVWDARTGALALRLRVPGEQFQSAEFSHDGSRIVTSSTDQTARIWDARTGAEIQSFRGHTATVISARFSPDGSRIVTLSNDQSVKIWDTRRTDVESLAVVSGSAGGIRSASFSPDGSIFATCSRLGKLWDVRTGAEAGNLLGCEFFNSVEYCPTGCHILASLTFLMPRSAGVWDAKTGQLLGLFPVHRRPEDQRYFKASSFSPDHKRILTLGDELRAWDWQTGRFLFKREVHSEPSSLDAGSAALGPDGVSRQSGPASFSSDGSLIVTAENDVATIRSADDGRELRTLRGHLGIITATSFSPDGERIVTSSDDRTAKVWDVDMGVELFTLKGHTAEVKTASFSPDGARIVTAGYDRTAKVWDAATGVNVLTLKGHIKDLLTAKFSPDGLSILTSSSDSTARVWDSRPFVREEPPDQRLDTKFAAEAERFRASFPGVLDTYSRALTRLRSGIAAYNQGNFEIAVLDFKQSSELFHSSRRSASDDFRMPGINNYSGTSLTYLAGSLRDLKRPAEAVAWYRESVKLYESFKSLSPNDLVSLAGAHAMISTLSDPMSPDEREKHRKQAVQCVGRAIEITQKIIELNPSKATMPGFEGRSLDPLRERADFRDLMMDAKFPRYRSYFHKSR